MATCGCELTTSLFEFLIGASDRLVVVHCIERITADGDEQSQSTAELSGLE